MKSFRQSRSEGVTHAALCRFPVEGAGTDGGSRPLINEVVVHEC